MPLVFSNAEFSDGRYTYTRNRSPIDDIIDAWIAAGGDPNTLWHLTTPAGEHVVYDSEAEAREAWELTGLVPDRVYPRDGYPCEEYDGLLVVGDGPIRIFPHDEAYRQRKMRGEALGIIKSVNRVWAQRGETYRRVFDMQSAAGLVHPTALRRIERLGLAGEIAR